MSIQLFNLPREGSTVFDIVFGPFKGDWSPREDKNRNKYVTLKVAQAGVVFKWLCYEPFLTQAREANLDRGDRVKVDVGTGDLQVKKGAAVGTLPEVPASGGGGGGGGGAPPMDFTKAFLAYATIYRMVGWSKLFNESDQREVATTMFIQWSRGGAGALPAYPEIYSKLKEAGLVTDDEPPKKPQPPQPAEEASEWSEDEIPF